MADGYLNAGDARERGRAVTSALSWVGGLISLSLIAGTGVWGYKLMMRDVTGVPVVRALEGPMRVAPDDPGGSTAAHQGLAVNRVVAAGSAGELVDTLILAPAPLELLPEDLPRPRLPDRPVLDQAVVLPDPAQSDEAPVEVQDIPEDALATDRAVAEALSTEKPTVLPKMTGDSRADALALAEALSEGVAPLSELSPLRDEVGLRRSPRPPSRPDRMASAATLAEDGEAEPLASNVESVSGTDLGEIPADSIPSGTRLVQLGAFESAEIAREQWSRIGGKFGEYFTGKRPVVQRAQAGGKTFYRLRAFGFADLSDARRFCSALMADKADCIPVVVR